MARLARFTSPLWDLDTFYVWDDFWADQSDLFWIDTITDTGTVAIGDVKNGIAVLIPSDGTVADNDEAYIESANEVFLFASNKPMYARAKLQFTEANTDDANIAFGFASAVAADLIVDNGAGLRASGCIAAIYKVDGETTWRAVTRNGANATVTASQIPAGGAAYQTLEVMIEHFSGTEFQVTFKVDGEYLVDANNETIIHRGLYASATEMAVFAGVKNGDTNLETLNVDYIYAHQLR